MVVRFYHYTSEESLAGIRYYETILPSRTGKFGSGVYFSRLGPRDLPLDKLAVNCFGAGGQARLRKGHLNCYIEVIVRNPRRVFEKCRAGGRDVYIYRGQMVLRQFAWRAGWVAGQTATLPMRRPLIQPVPLSALGSQNGICATPFVPRLHYGNCSPHPLHSPGSQGGNFPPFTHGSQDGYFNPPYALGPKCGNFPPTHTPGSQGGNFPGSQGGNFPLTYAPGSHSGNLSPPYSHGSWGGNFSTPYSPGVQGGNFPPFTHGSQGDNFPTPYSSGSKDGNFSPPYALGSKCGNFPPTDSGNFPSPRVLGSNYSIFPHPCAPESLYNITHPQGHDLDFSATYVGEPHNDYFSSSKFRGQSQHDFTHSPANVVADKDVQLGKPASFNSAQTTSSSSSSTCSVSVNNPLWNSYNSSPGREPQPEAGSENKENEGYFRRFGGKKRKVFIDSAKCVSAKRKKINNNHKVTVSNVKSEVNNDSGYLSDMNSSQVAESVDKEYNTKTSSNDNGNISQVINQTVEILQKVCNWVGL